MRFRQIDRITDIQPGSKIVAVRKLLAEETYLKDHFPYFPVMPGVLMVEAMFQAGAWLVRKSEEFEHAMVVLKEARNVKYKDFVEPGQELVVTAEIIKQDERLTTLKAEGRVDGNVAVNARLIIERFDLATDDPSKEREDVHLRQRFRQFYSELEPKPLETT